MPDTVYERVAVIQEDDIAVLAHDLHDQDMGTQIAHLVAVFDRDAQDALQTGLPDRKDASVLKMFAQQHAEGRRLQGSLPGGPCQIDEGEGRVGAEVEAELAAAPVRGRTDGEHQLVSVCLRDFINAAACERFLQLSAESGDSDSIKSHNRSPNSFLLNSPYSGFSLSFP